jgi:CRP-like cAMP-binding protein
MVDKVRVPNLSRETGFPGRLSISAPTSSDGDGNHIHNKILLGLPAKEAELLYPKLEFVRLKVHHVLHEPGDSLKSAFFPNAGLVSILSVFPDGKCVEVGLVGKDGFIGLPLLAGFRTANTRAIIQIEASAFRIDADVLAGALQECPVLERRLQQFAQILAMEVTQVAACNRLHEVNERLARWLLMCADRVDSNSVPLTQEFLAHMLGTRRSSVTVAAGMLETAGLISNSRGQIDIVDRPRLEKAACECYQIMRSQLSDWRSESA